MANTKARMAEMEKKLSLARKKACLEIIANIAAQTGDYSDINNVDLKLELIVDALHISKK